MIGRIKGVIDHVSKNYVIVDVNKIGYIVYTINPEKLQIGTDVELYTHMYVREDQISLYGFKNIHTKEAFLKLNSISGVGPKASLNILSHLDTTTLYNAVVNNSKDVFKPIPGVGPKLAQRIILELQNNIEASSLNTNIDSSIPIDIKNTLLNDTIMALVSLGISHKDASKYAYEATTNCKEVGDAISYALKLMKT